MAILLAILAAACFGIGGVFVRKGVHASNTYTGAIVNITVNSLVLLPFGIPYLFSIHFAPAALLIFVLIGFFVPTISRFLAVAGIERIGVSRSQAVVATSPLFSILLAIGLLGERPSPLVLLGAFSIVAGLILLSQNRAGEQMWRKKDLIYPLGAGLLFSGRDVVAKVGLTQGVPPILGGAVAATTSAVFLWILRGMFHKQGTLSCDRKSFWNLVASGFFWGLSYLFSYSALEAGDVAVVTPLIYSAPLFSAFLSMIFLKDLETVTLRVILGAVLVVSGGIGIAMGR